MSTVLPTVIFPSAKAVNDSIFERCSRSVSGHRCFATENVAVFKLFQRSVGRKGLAANRTKSDSRGIGEDGSDTRQPPLCERHDEPCTDSPHEQTHLLMARRRLDFCLA